MMPFIDTQYLLARSFPRDPWHQAAQDAVRKMRRNVSLVTTTEVLTEFLTGASGMGAFYRQRATLTVETILSDPKVKVIPPSYSLFLRGLELYKNRLDKSYSMVDCISMCVMREEGLQEVLSSDHHFEQEGFTCLIK